MWTVTIDQFILFICKDSLENYLGNQIVLKKVYFGKKLIFLKVAGLNFILVLNTYLPPTIPFLIFEMIF